MNAYQNVDLDAPMYFSEARLFFIGASRKDLNAAKTLLGPVLLSKQTIGHRAETRTTVLTIGPPLEPISVREAVSKMRAKFGHIKSYDGCDMQLSICSDVAKEALS